MFAGYQTNCKIEGILMQLCGIPHIIRSFKLPLYNFSNEDLFINNIIITILARDLSIVHKALENP